MYPPVPCLYDVVGDPAERHNLARQLPAVVARLNTRLVALVSNNVRLPLRMPDNGTAFCEAVKTRGPGPGSTSGFSD